MGGLSMCQDLKRSCMNICKCLRQPGCRGAADRLCYRIDTNRPALSLLLVQQALGVLCLTPSLYRVQNVLRRPAKQCAWLTYPGP
jgi:hypothetical protein